MVHISVASAPHMALTLRGTTGVIIPGGLGGTADGAGGTADGAYGVDRFSGRSSTGTFSLSRSGLTAITTRSGRYGDVFVWDAMFWPGPDYTSGAGSYDVYGEHYAYGGPARTRTADPATSTAMSLALRTNTNDLAQTCGGLAPGVTDLPVDYIEQTIQPTDQQREALVALKAASSQASDVLKASCSSEALLTPLGRLDTVQKRLDGMVQALRIVRTPLDNFYNSLSEEQRQRFAALGTARKRALTVGDPLRATIWLRSAAAARKVSRSRPSTA